MKLSVVVPVFNEAENLVPLMSEIDTALKKVENVSEMIYVDDGSTDDSPDIFSRAIKDFPDLRVIRHSYSCGQSTALRTGILAASGDLIVTLDGDGQNDPADIPALLSKMNDLESGKTWMISGWRVNRRDTWIRRISSKVANKIRGGLLQDSTPDTGCGLKLFPRSVFLQLPYFDHMHRFLPALVIRAGGTVTSVAVNHRQRHKGSSKYGVHNRLWVGITDLIGVMWLMRRAKIPHVVEITKGTEVNL
jgi:dolichol-phosphate mannosyltransferase